MKPQFPVTRSDAEWRKLLNPEQYMVMRRFGTEAAGSCALNHEKRAGTFVCAGCDQPLFVSKTKYESNTGWPSFTDPIDGAVGTKKDPVYGDLQVEVHCRQCGMSSWTRFSRWATPDKSALLHQWRGNEISCRLNPPSDVMWPTNPKRFGPWTPSSTSFFPSSASS